MKNGTGTLGGNPPYGNVDDGVGDLRHLVPDSLILERIRELTRGIGRGDLPADTFEREMKK